MCHRLARSRGLSLIELLVAIAIGAVLIFGATKVYVDSKNTYEVNETAARLQETARYAMSVVEPDIRMSNYWGLVKGAGVIDGQTPPASGPLTTCGADFTSDLLTNLEGNNNGYAFTCAAYDNAPSAVADTLTIRRASVRPASGGATDRVRICSTRISGERVLDSSGCTAAPAGQVNDLVVNGYYIGRNLEGLPALRRHALAGGAGGPVILDEEIIPGIEDMQIQFGVDPTGVSGMARRYVNPGDVGAGEQIVSVRIWLLVRAENPEVGFRDTATYEYADRAAYAPDDGFRRLLVSRTIQIRNALGT